MLHAVRRYRCGMSWWTTVALFLSFSQGGRQRLGVPADHNSLDLRRTKTMLVELSAFLAVFSTQPIATLTEGPRAEWNTDLGPHALESHSNCYEGCRAMQTQLVAQLAEAEARKRQLESVDRDCSRLCTLDNNRPFTDGADAFDRLLPWHVVATGDPLEADSEKAEAAEVLKHQAWLEASRKANIASLERIQGAAQKLGVQLAETQPSQAGKALESYLLERLLFEDEKLQLTRARTALTDRVQLGQLQQAASANQRAAQAAAQHAQAQFRPAASAPQAAQPAAWPVANGTAAQPAPVPGTLSGFRSFSITGKAKPPA